MVHATTEFEPVELFDQSAYRGQEFSAAPAGVPKRNEFAAVPDPKPRFTDGDLQASIEDTPVMRRVDNIRRWSSAKTHRLNEDQWCGVNGNPINVDLQADRPTLVARSRHLRFNNSMVEGVVDSYALDVVGENGPTLTVHSSDDNYNREFKKIWDRVWSTLCTEGIHGTDLLKRLVGQEADNGDWLQQLVNHPKYEREAVSTRLMDIDPERMSSDPKDAGNPMVTMGVVRNSFGEPTAYQIRNPRDQYRSHFWGELSYNWETIPADDILHVFGSREAGQVRGFPWLSSSLQDMADLADYDEQVLDAARFAANNSGVIWTTDPLLATGTKSGEVAAVYDMPRRSIRKIPAGYQFTQMQAAQPTAEYVPFRHEKLRSFGRVKHIPLIMILLSAEKANFSQSRIDINLIYEKGIKAYRKFIERSWLFKLVDMVKREASLKARPGRLPTDPDFLVLPPEPEDVQYKFGWQPIGQANPKDHIEFVKMAIALGIWSPEMECAEHGISEDMILESIAKTNAKREELGLDPIILGDPKKPEEPPGNQTHDTSNSNTSKPARSEHVKRWLAGVARRFADRLSSSAA